ncbi:MAG: hypothetical protein P1R58_03635 [bacterium]|nr:hypothetical protein [bacterium]
MSQKQKSSPICDRIEPGNVNFCKAMISLTDGVETVDSYIMVRIYPQSDSFDEGPKGRLVCCLYTAVLCVLVVTTARARSPRAFDDSGWTEVYREDFNSVYEASDGQVFGTEGWLVYQILNGATITVDSGFAHIKTPDFWNAALIHSTEILPQEYKIRTKIGRINYDLTNYEAEDYVDPNFQTHNGFYENGMYFLTVTDGLCVGNECAELWWHYHRKMVIDVDNHLDGGGGQTFHPVFMVYMAPEINSGGNLLRTWTGTFWDTSPWNWNVAHTYDYNTWYYAELEKTENVLILRLYDESKNIIQETTPVDLSLVFAMDDSTEYLYLGEPHTDDYEGDVLVDEITLLVPGCCRYRGDANHSGGSTPVDISDLTYFADYFFAGGAAPVCTEEGDTDGSGGIDITDITYVVNFMFDGGLPPPPCD